MGKMEDNKTIATNALFNDIKSGFSVISSLMKNIILR